MPIFRRTNCILTASSIVALFFFNFYYCSEVSNIHLVTKDYKIVPLTNLLRLLLAGRVMGGERSF